jgi:ATP-dependent exoDNAse (exonuclease V) alpha subunit
VAYAAYLAAERLHDEHYNEDRLFDKKRLKQRVYHSEILAPENAPAWARHREELWNRNEAAERRKDSQVGREIIVALPKELSHQQKIAAGLQFVREEYVFKGMVADVHFHHFTGKGSDNPHMQVLLTTRRIEAQGFAKKKEEAWRPPIVKDPKTHKIIVDPEFIKAER